MSAFTVIICNGCGAEARAYPLQDSAATRRQLATRKWRHPNRGVDYCPNCAKKRAEDDRARNTPGYF